MKQDFFYPSHDGKTTIHAAAWLPEGKPKAILQICHGMCEHIWRYDEFARYLAEKGFCVVGNDHLGHGTSVTSVEEHGYFSEKDGDLIVLKDLHTLRRRMEHQFPGVPYFMLGHSMGSFLLRQYIGRCGKRLAGAILMGTGNSPLQVLASIKRMCRSIALFKGWHAHSNTLNRLSFGNYNKEFEPVRTPYDWLSKDEARVDTFLNDPLCSFHFTVNGYYNLFSMLEDCQLEPVVAGIPKELPLLLISGDKDPVGDNGKDVRELFRTYQAAGIVDLEIKLFANDRHNLLDETDRAEVYAYLLRWLELHIPE
ncbi:MAG: alpha/beta fold hydrolase [Oscillospiraceae bacterium]|nr:alpha/beta fold hydrolase [Oscillospiraceae bacterium]